MIGRSVRVRVRVTVTFLMRFCSIFGSVFEQLEICLVHEVRSVISTRVEA